MSAMKAQAHKVQHCDCHVTNRTCRQPGRMETPGLLETKFLGRIPYLRSVSGLLLAPQCPPLAKSVGSGPPNDYEGFKRLMMANTGHETTASIRDIVAQEVYGS